MKEFSAYSDIFLSRAQVYLSYFLPAPPSVKDDNNNNNNDGGNNQNDILFNLGNQPPNSLLLDWIISLPPRGYSKCNL